MHSFFLFSSCVYPLRGTGGSKEIRLQIYTLFASNAFEIQSEREFWRRLFSISNWKRDRDIEEPSSFEEKCDAIRERDAQMGISHQPPHHACILVLTVGVAKSQLVSQLAIAFYSWSNTVPACDMTKTAYFELRRNFLQLLSSQPKLNVNDKKECRVTAFLEFSE